MKIKSMNTWIWGPPKWKFLHTLSFSPQVVTRYEEVTPFVESVQHVLPCVYCRDSYSTFLPQLQQRFGPLPAVIQQGKLSLWMYALHDMVNAKLDRQLAEDMFQKEGVQVSADKITTLCRKRQITYECLTKRFIIRPVQFCDDDIWEFLEIFALNADATKGEMTAPRVAGHYTFFSLFPLMLQLAGASASLVYAVQAGAPYFEAAFRSSSSNAIFEWVLKQKRMSDMYKSNELSLQDVQDPTVFPRINVPRPYASEEEYVFNRARSNPKSCTHGSCQ